MWKAFMILIIAAVATPSVVAYYNELTDPLTGVLVSLPTPEWLIVLLGLIPWIFPIGLFIYAMLLMAGRDKPSV